MRGNYGPSILREDSFADGNAGVQITLEISAMIRPGHLRRYLGVPIMMKKILMSLLSPHGLQWCDRATVKQKNIGEEFGTWS